MSCATNAKAVAWEEMVGLAEEDKMAFFQKGFRAEIVKKQCFWGVFLSFC
jgi:hypothetical protein